MDNQSTMVDLQGGQEPSATPMSPPALIEAVAYGEDGKLTREGMELIIKAGRSVIYGTSVIWRIEDLPSEAQLAQGDARKQAAVRENLQQQVAALAAQLQAVSPPKDQHAGDTGLPHLLGATLPGEERLGVVGEGDTAGFDGDASDPESLAGKKAAAEAEAKAAANKKVADEKAEADKLAEEARAKLEAETQAAIAKSKKEA